ncbi:MAG: phosphodiester glycosidase family protein [Clostridia bacterium]|nr:phosphodiester glycosidase family protein [Clostridia bacterium]
MKQSRFLILYGLVLVLFTLYVALDTFVITRVYTVSDATPQAATSAVLPTTAPAIVTATSYSDANITITLTEYREHDTTIYVADVTLTSPELLKTALAEDSFGRNISQKTSEMAEANGAILAINGDYYGSRERGYVVRNGALYRSSASSDTEALAIMADGSFRVVQEGVVAAEALVEDGAMHVFSFGPALLVDGEIAVTTRDEVGKAMEDNPRTAIGVYEPGHYVLLVADGRTRQSDGLTLYDLAEFMQGLGVTTAYNLDGGGSSSMVFMGEIINNPTTNGRKITERSVSDIVYIGY